MQMTHMDQLPSEEGVMTSIDDQGGEKAESRSSGDIIRQEEDHQDEAHSSLASREKSEAEGVAHQAPEQSQSQPKSQQQQQQSHYQGQ